MRVTVVEAPEPVVSFAEAAARLRLDSSEQADVEAMIATATDMFDVENGWLGRAIGEQTLELRCDSFTGPSGALKLPFPPIAALVSVKYLDRDGVEQMVPTGDCDLMGEELHPAHGKAWPATLARREAVRIQYSAGYDVVPPAIKGAILLAVGDMYRFRESLALTTVDALRSAGSIANLLATIRKFR